MEQVDKSKVQQAMAKLAAEKKEREEAEKKREKELASVKVRASVNKGQQAWRVSVFQGCWRVMGAASFGCRGRQQEHRAWQRCHGAQSGWATTAASTQWSQPPVGPP